MWLEPTPAETHLTNYYAVADQGSTSFTVRPVVESPREGDVVDIRLLSGGKAD